MKKNSSGAWSPDTPVSMNNPEKRDEKDWWDEMCKAHAEENHWKKKKNPKTKANDEG